MARLKARVEFLLSVIKLLFLSLGAKAKGVKNHCYQEGVGQFEARFRGRGRTDAKKDEQTDSQTDGIAVVSTAVAIRALRRAVQIINSS